MFNAISTSYDRVNRILSFGIDVRWRKKMVEHLPQGERLTLLDLATGTCDQLLTLMQSGKFASAIGMDLAEEMLKMGREKVSQSPFSKKVVLQLASALEIPLEENVFDCVSISFGIRNVVDIAKCLEEMHRVLKPGGKGLILEFSLPKNRAVRFFHLLYLRYFLPLIGGIVSGKRSAYSYLNQTIESFPYGNAFCQFMEKGGFTKVKAYPLTWGVATLYVGEKG